MTQSVRSIQKSAIDQGKKSRFFGEPLQKPPKMKDSVYTIGKVM